MSSGAPITAEGLQAVMERKISLLMIGMRPDTHAAPAGNRNAWIDNAVDTRAGNALLDTHFQSSANPHNQYELSIAFAEGFSATRAVVVRVDDHATYELGSYTIVRRPRFSVDFDRFEVSLRVRSVDLGLDAFQLMITPGASTLVADAYRRDDDEPPLLTSLLETKCASITPALIDRLLAHIRLLDNIAACRCGTAFVRGLDPGAPEACEECLMRATPQQLQETIPCAICREDAHTSFAFKCPDCSCYLHQSCLLKLWKDKGLSYSSPKCPQCRRALKRPADATQISPFV